MAKIVKIDLSTLSDVELKTSLKESSLKLQNDKLNHAITPLENPKTIMQQRRNVARMHTELRKREISK
jgi:large subunit ribosomal protein L29